MDRYYVTLKTTKHSIEGPVVDWHMDKISVELKYSNATKVIVPLNSVEYIEIISDKKLVEQYSKEFEDAD